LIQICSYSLDFLLGKMRLFQIMNILSIDVAFGAAISCLFFAKLCNVEIFPIELVVLILTVWIIYTMDHLMDARGLTRPASTKRHRFHQLNYSAIRGWLFVAGIVNVTLICFIRRPLYLTGGALTLMICFYFLFQRRQEAFKEVAGAVLYMSGVLIIPLTLFNGMVNYEKVIIIFQFGCIVLTNLLLFALFDEQTDKNDNHLSFTISFGPTTTRNVLVALFVMSASFSIVQLLWLRFALGANIVLTTMNVVLFFVFIKRSCVEKDEWYRSIGDGVFLIPSLYILFS
jgi:hypothetical protein